jgi:hypothetical protein
MCLFHANLTCRYFKELCVDREAQKKTRPGTFLFCKVVIFFNIHIFRQSDKLNKLDVSGGRMKVMIGWGIRLFIFLCYVSLLSIFFPFRMSQDMSAIRGVLQGDVPRAPCRCDR